MRSSNFNTIFHRCIKEYHEVDNIDTTIENPFDIESFDALLYQKCWIDTVQWHLEDLIREKGIDPEEALKLKREIDASNQRRTDMVEEIDDHFYNVYADVEVLGNARLNTETPAWAIDRLSILHLKIYHMREEAVRADASDAHKQECSNKLKMLEDQLEQLSIAIDQLLEEVEEGRCKITTYKQMKMYNDDELNPVLRKQKH